SVGYDDHLYVARYSSPLKVILAANHLYGLPYTVYAHPNFILPKDFRNKRSNDTFYGAQWHLENTGQTDGVAGADISIRDAWGFTKGDPSIIIAVLDAGFQREHPDMTGAWAVNAAEIAGNNKDDDSNGYIDDVIGWSFFRDNGDINQGSYLEHGVSVAGL